MAFPPVPLLMLFEATDYVAAKAHVLIYVKDIKAETLLVSPNL